MNEINENTWFNLIVFKSLIKFSKLIKINQN